MRSTHRYNDRSPCIARHRQMWSASHLMNKTKKYVADAQKYNACNRVKSRAITTATLFSPADMAIIVGTLRRTTILCKRRLGVRNWFNRPLSYQFNAFCIRAHAQSAHSSHKQLWCIECTISYEVRACKSRLLEKSAPTTLQDERS